MFVTKAPTMTYQSIMCVHANPNSYYTPSNNNYYFEQINRFILEFYDINIFR
jgi:hypothetical protein